MTSGRLRLSRLISDAMVLQRDTAAKVWGWAYAGDTVIVGFAGRQYRCAAGNDGKWETLLEPMPAGGPYTMEITAWSGGSQDDVISPKDTRAERDAASLKNGTSSWDNTPLKGGILLRETIILKDILVGDVFVCSGQSNMLTPVLRLTDLFEKEIKASCKNEIRYFHVPERHDFNAKHTDLENGDWIIPDADSVLNFSAVPLFFAAAVNRRYNVPVGMINASVGGTPIEAWMGEEALRDWPDKLEELAICKDTSYVEKVKRMDTETVEQWYRQLDSIDAGLADPENNWSDVNADTSEWSAVILPKSWNDAGLMDFCGSIWLKKAIYIPPELAGKSAVLRLGTIVDSDVTYFNGVEAGAVAYRYPPRKYVISEDLIREGENIITIRCISNLGDGGFVEDKPYRLEIGGKVIDLAGEWKYRIGAIMDIPFPEMTNFSCKPVGLYNGMISPLMDYLIRGILWYQGEANTSAPREYPELLKSLITDWRKKWKLGSLPFLFVQLHNFMKPAAQPGNSGWAAIREAQLSALSMPDTGMATAIDAGEWNDIHPLDKKTVADRLALAAYKVVYGEDIVCSGPIYKEAVRDGSRFIISFREPAGRLVSKDGGPLKHFAVAGSDRKFVWADARIEGNTVVVWNNAVPEPVAVRYAWADNPEGANLYNEEGLPASPFRTDDWDE